MRDREPWVLTRRGVRLVSALGYMAAALGLLLTFGLAGWIEGGMR